MIRIRKILLAVVIVFVAIQFIRPARNKSGQVSPMDFTKVYAVPGDVQALLQNTCYDCHSNNTSYPWYAHIQPVAWLLAKHIREGKAKLNFSEFGSYAGRRRVSKLKEIISQVRDNEMPLSSYKLMHKNARLSEAEKNLLMTWMNKIADSLSVNQ